MIEYGLSGDVNKVCIDKDAVCAVVELHGEQGPVLEEEGIDTEHFCGRATMTAGQLNLSPSSSNCIPGKCVFTLDIRSGDGDILKNILKKVDFCAREQEKAGMEVETKTLSYREPVLMDEKLQSEIEKSCQKLNLSYRYLDSGAAMRSHRNFICPVMIWEEVISSQVKISSAKIRWNRILQTVYLPIPG